MNEQLVQITIVAPEKSGRPTSTLRTAVCSLGKDSESQHSSQEVDEMEPTKVHSSQFKSEKSHSFKNGCTYIMCSVKFM